MKGSRAKKPAAPWSPEQIERRPVSSLLPYARNARTHSEAQVAQIAASIREFGFTNPILVDGSSGIIAGHGRVLAAKLIGMAEVPVIELAHLSETQKRALIIADNQIALNAAWNDEILAAEIGALKVEGFDLALTGFGDGELLNIFLDRDTGTTDADAEWVGMPEYEADEPCYRKIVVSFDSADDVQAFFARIAQSYTEKTKSIWFPEKERRDLESMRWSDDG